MVNLFLLYYLIFFYQNDLKSLSMYSVLIYAIFGISAAVYLFGYFYIKGYSWKLNQILDNFELENKCKIKIQRNKLLLIINWIDNPALYEAEDENEKMIEEEKKKQAAF